jgi:hypothetical protein
VPGSGRGSAAFTPISCSIPVTERPQPAGHSPALRRFDAACRQHLGDATAAGNRFLRLEGVLAGDAFTVSSVPSLQVRSLSYAGRPGRGGKRLAVISGGFELHLAWKMTATGSLHLRRSPGTRSVCGSRQP